MPKPRIFLGSSGKQAKLLQALTRGLEDIAHVDPWTTSFNPGTTTLERLVELAHEVDFAAFVFASDDWTTGTAPASNPERNRPGFSARQCRLRGRSFRRSPRDAPHLHPPCARLKASNRSARTYIHTIRRNDAERDESHHSEASRRDRKRWADRADRGPVVAVLADRAEPMGAFSRQPAANLAGPRWHAGAQRTLLAGRRQAVGEILPAKRRARGRTLRACSTVGRENGRWTRTRRSWTGQARSNWNRPIARQDISRLVPTCGRK